MRKRKISRALCVVRERLSDPSWRPIVSRDPSRRLIFSREPDPSSLPYEGFYVGALAHEKCTHCGGTGTRTTRVMQEICPCVYRAIARRCASEYDRIQSIPHGMPRRRRGGICFDLPRHEWAADFWHIICRTLTDRRERDIWVSMRLLHLPHSEVDERVGLDRGTLFHCLYRADQRIGEAVCWMKPYPLWTLRMYCG